jgi:hypothetical protein
MKIDKNQLIWMIKGAVQIEEPSKKPSVFYIHSCIHEKTSCVIPPLNEIQTEI